MVVSFIHWEVADEQIREGLAVCPQRGKGLSSHVASPGRCSKLPHWPAGVWNRRHRRVGLPRFPHVALCTAARAAWSGAAICRTAG